MLIWETWCEFATGDFCSKVLSSALVSVLTTLITLRIKGSQDVSTAVCKEAVEGLKHIRTQSDAAFKLILNHFEGPKSFADSRKEIGTATKELSNLVSSLEHYFNRSEIGNLIASYTSWEEGVLGEEFPVSKKSDCFQKNDPRFEQRKAAHKSWCDRIDALKARCLKDFQSVKSRN
jgi:hypothetical protein